MVQAQVQGKGIDGYRHKYKVKEQLVQSQVQGKGTAGTGTSTR